MRAGADVRALLQSQAASRWREVSQIGRAPTYLEEQYRVDNCVAQTLAVAGRALRKKITSNPSCYRRVCEAVRPPERGGGTPMDCDEK